MLASAALHFPIDAHKRPVPEIRPEMRSSPPEPTEFRKDQRSPPLKPDDQEIEKPPHIPTSQIGSAPPSGRYKNDVNMKNMAV